MSSNQRQKLLYTIFYQDEEVGRLRHANFSYDQDDVDDNWENIILNPVNDGIKESHITAYRNFLIEFDPNKEVWASASEIERSLMLNSQATTVIESKAPVSAAVYSGNKSIHFLIALKNPVSRECWKIYRKALQTAFPDADTNSSAVIGVRNPGNVRIGTGNTVCLYGEIGCYQKIGNDEFKEWLGPYLNEAVEEYEDENNVMINIDFLDKPLRNSTEDFLKYGADDGEWNQELFKASCDLFNHGHSVGEVEETIKNINDEIDCKDKATIKSAFDTVKRIK